jgi:hypothetical protein
VNLLVVGPDHAVDEVIVALKRDARRDGENPAPTGIGSGDGAFVSMWGPGSPFVLPSPASAGTMILRDVDTLVHDDQQTLVTWLEQAAGRVQVVSTASSSLMPLVEAGVFMQTLYYRLNTIYMDLTSRRFSSGDW